MKLDDFNNIDFKNMGGLPMPVKMVLLCVLFLILLGLGYWFLWSGQLTEIDQAKAKEQNLRKVFLDKKAQAVKVTALTTHQRFFQYQPFVACRLLP